MNPQELDSILFPANGSMDKSQNYSPTESHEDLSNILQRIPFPPSDPSENLTKTFTPFKDNIISSSLTPKSIMKWNFSNIKQNANELFPTVIEPTMTLDPMDKSPEPPARNKSHFDSNVRSSKRPEYPSDKKNMISYRDDGSSQGKLKTLKEQLLAVENELNYEKEKARHIEREFEKKMSEIRKQHQQDEERWEYEIRKMRDSREKEMGKLQEIITHQKRILDDEKVSIKNSKNAYLTPLMRMMASLGILTSNDMDFEENLRRIFEYIKELREKIQGSENRTAEFKKKEIALSSELDITKMENNQLKETLKTNQGKNAENIEKIATLHNELLVLKNESSSLQLQLKTSKDEIQQLKSRENTNSNEVEIQIKNFQNDIKQKENENIKLKEKIRLLEEDHTKQSQGGDLLLKGLKNEIREFEFELKKEKERYQKLKDQENENENRLEEIQSLLTSKEKELKEAKEQIRNKERQNLKVSDEIMMKNKDLNLLQAASKQAEQTIETLRKENKDLNIKIDMLKQTIVNREGDIDETSEPKPDLNKLRDENKKLAQEIYQLKLNGEAEKENKDNNNVEVEKLLSSFSQKETEFENIKQSFINKLMTANEKLAIAEQKCGKLVEENNQLRNQVETHENDKGEFEMRSTVHSTSDEPASPDYANNILEMISPEMLSSDETIFLVLEMLRRISQSNKLAITLMKNREFKDLTQRICKHYTQAKQDLAYKSEPVSSRNSTRTMR